MIYSTGICVFLNYYFDSLFLLLISVFAASLKVLFGSQKLGDLLLHKVLLIYIRSWKKGWSWIREENIRENSEVTPRALTNHRTLSNNRLTVVMNKWHSLGINFKGHSLQVLPGKQGVWRAGHCLGRPQVSLCLSRLYLIKTTAPYTLPVEPFILPRTQHREVQMAPSNFPSLKVAIKAGWGQSHAFM